MPIDPASLPWPSVLDARDYGSLSPTGIAQLSSSAQAATPPSAILVRIEQVEGVPLIIEPTMTITSTEWEEVEIEVPPRPDAATATIEERLAYLEARDLARDGTVPTPVTITETIDLPEGAIGWFGPIAAPVFVDDTPLPEEEPEGVAQPAGEGVVVDAPADESLEAVDDGSTVE